MKTGLIALVTGGNKGIGLAVARQLAEAGVFVIIGSRNSVRGRVAVEHLHSHGLAAQTLLIDLDDHATILTAANDIATKYGRLDILINNAAIGDPDDGAPDVASIEAVRRTLNTNFIGTLAVTQAMLPLLRRASAGRIVNISSFLGSLSVTSDPTSPLYAMHRIGYAASKAALNMLTVQLAAELRGTRIVVNSVSPGYVKTDLNDHSGHLTPDEGATWPVAWALVGADAKSGQFVEAGGELAW